MLIYFTCANCRTPMEIDSTSCGSVIECPTCNSSVTVPEKKIGPGITVGGFKIERLLGEGGMGQVWLAKQLSMDRQVALKILPSTLEHSKELKDRFLNEVRISARLQHTNIVSAHEAGEDAGVLFLAMEYVKGITLDERLRRDKILPEKEALEITRKVAAALDYAWTEHKILHRDIKPSNVMLDKNSEPKVMDMGLSKSLDTHEGLTLSGDIMGTPNYMSPEQAEGKSDVDSRSDMYSLGLTLYHMVTGAMPYAGSSLMETLRKQVNESLPDPRELNPAVTDACTELLVVMTAYDRSMRPSSWPTLLKDIDTARLGSWTSKPLAAGTSTILHMHRDKGVKLRPSVKARHSVPAWAPVSPPVEPAKPEKPVWLIPAVAVGIVVIVAVLGFALGSKDDTAQPLAAIPASTAAASASAADPLAGLSNRFVAALQYAQSQSDDFNGVLEAFEAIRKDGADTEYEVKAGEQIQRLEAAKRQKVDAAWQGLKQAAEKLAGQKQYAEGIARLEQYAGAYAAETASDRKKLAEELTAKEQAQKEEQTKQQSAEEDKKQKTDSQATEKVRLEAAQARLNAVLGEMAIELLHGDYEATAKLMAGARGEVALLPMTNEVIALAELTAKVTGINQVILESFDRENNRVTEVELRSGKVEKLRIAGVSGGKIKGKREISGGFIERELGVNELSLREKMRRLGTGPPSPGYGGQAISPSGSIMRGLLVFEGGDAPAAETCFKEAGPGLGAALAAEAARQVAERQARLASRKKAPVVSATPVTPASPTPLPSAITPGLKKAPPATTGPETAKIPDTPSEKASRTALIEILKLAGVGAELTKSRDLMRQIAAKGYPEADAAKIQVAAAEFEKTQGETETAKSQWRLLDFLKQVGPDPRPPLLQATEENLNRAIEDWRIENHGAIGETKSSIKDGTNVTIYIPNCPAQTVRALGDLPISAFCVESGKIRDIAPLADCPLTTLYLPKCPIEDFSTLKNIKTLRYLDLQYTQIKDLDAVQGLTNLVLLNVRETLVKDLSPLNGMLKLTSLTCGPMVKVNDLVLGCPLKQLFISGWPIKNINFVTNFPALTDLSVSSAPVKDLSPLRDLKLLTRLVLGDMPARDLSPMEGLPVRDLNITGVPATNLNVLAGMPIKDLQMGHPDVVLDLSSSLAGKDLNTLRLRGKVTTFAPFKEDVRLPFLQLSFDWAKVPDAAKLPEYIPSLESISIPYPGQAEAEIVLRSPNLKKVQVPPAPGKDAVTISFDEFKEKFGPKEKADPKTAKPKPK